MSEGANAGSTAASHASHASQGSPGGSSSVDQGAAAASAADPKASGEAIYEMLAANDPIRPKKRKYPEPDFPIERSGAVGRKGSYPIRFKLKAAAFTRVVCEDGNPVGNSGAANVLGVDRKRVIEWVREEESLKGKVNANPKMGKAKQVHAGVQASTADVEEELVDYINGQRKQHNRCGSQEVMNKLLELKPDALGGLPANAKPEETLAFKVKFNSWYQRFHHRKGFSIRRRTSVGPKLPNGHEGMAWASLMKLRKALLGRAGEIYARRHPPAPGESPIKREDLTAAQLESVTAEVFEELGNMDQTPVQHDMPVETNLEKTGVKEASISTGGKEIERFTLCLAVLADGKKVPLRIIFKGTPFIPPATPGKGKATQPRRNSIAAEILPETRQKFGQPAGGMSFGVQAKSWCDQRECNLWIKDSWKLRPNGGSIVQQRPCILVLDDFKCHKDEDFIAALKRDANTIVIFIPGVLNPLLQPLDRMLNKQMKRLLRGMYTAHTASATRNPKTGKLAPPGRGVVSTWCKKAWASITPETIKTCFKICGLTLALDGSDDHACCMHSFGEGYRELLEQQRVEWLAQYPGVSLPALQLPEVPAASSTNHITAAAKELEANLLPSGDDSDVEILEDDSEAEVVDGSGGGGADGAVAEL